MADDRDRDVGARIIAGPGLVGRPERVAAALSARVRESIEALEAAANCPELALDLPQGLSPDARFLRFVDAVAAMAAPTLDELVGEFCALCVRERLEPAAEAAILHDRAADLIAYFCQLARVHGLAFASHERAPSAVEVERALASLAGDLRARLEAELRRRAAR